MQYHNLGKSDIKVSEISFGCMSLKAGSTSHEKVIHQAIALGVNFFDTADLYEFGLNEELLAKAINGKRQELIIATKVGNQWHDARDGWTWNPSKEYILSAVEASLKRLKTDYIDLYQLHGGTIDDPIDETIEAFDLLKSQGKIREYGISSIRPNVIREYARRSSIQSVMMQFSLLDRRPEEACTGLISDSEISIITRGTLAKGLLAGKLPAAYLDHSTEEVESVQQHLIEIAKNYQTSPSIIASKYILAKHPVASAVIGFRTIDQVTDVLNDFDKVSLTTADQQLLNKAAKKYTYANHR